MNTKKHIITPTLALLSISSVYAQGVDKNAANYKKGEFSDYLSIADQAVESNKDNLPEKFDKDVIIKALGLSNIQSYEQSSTPDKTEWVNHIQLNNGGNNEGIFQILTDSKHQGLVVPKMAPAGTDLALQLSLNLSQIESQLSSVIEMGEDEEINQFKEGLSSEVPMLGVTTSELLKKLDLRLNFALDLDANEKLPTPIGEFNKPHITGRIDGIAWIWDKVGPMAIGGTGLPFGKVEENGITTYSLPAEMAAQFMGYSPVVQVDANKDQIWLSSTPDFLAKCTSGENTLADSPAFKATMQQLPSEGVSMTYASKEFYEFFVSSMANLQETGMLDGADEVAKAQLDTALKDAAKIQTGAAQVISKNSNGVLFSERGVQNIEQKMAELVKALDELKNSVEEAVPTPAETE